VLFQPCRSSSLLATFKMSCYVSMNEIKWWWWRCHSILLNKLVKLTSNAYFNTRQINNCSDKLSVLCTRTVKNSIYSSVEHMVQRSNLRKINNFREMDLIYFSKNNKPKFNFILPKIQKYITTQNTLQYSYQKLSKSDNFCSSYSQKCSGCFLRHSVVAMTS